MGTKAKFILGLICLIFLVADAPAQDFELYVVDVGPNRGQPWQVIKYDQNGQNPETFISAGLNRPQDIIFLEDQGIALVSSLGSGRITRHNATSGNFINDFATGINQPTRMKIGADNLLYVLQWGGTGTVRRYTLDGDFVDDFTDVRVSNSIGMDWDSQGNLYVSSWDARHVRKFDSNGKDLGLFVTTNLQGPTNIWFDTDGSLLVMDWTGRAIRRYNSNGAFQNTFVNGLNQPEGIEFLSNGDFLIGNGGTSSVRQYNGSGTFVKDFVQPGLGGLSTPNGLRIRLLSSFKMNAGLNDAWFNSATDGQGFFITVFPGLGLVSLAWFTYDTTLPGEGETAKLGDPGHRWLTALGTINGNTSIMTVSIASGGLFDTSTEINRRDDGTLTLTFVNCRLGKVDYNIPSINRQGSVDITRVAEDNVELCETLDAR